MDRATQETPILLRILRSAMLAYAGVLLLMVVLQGNLVYHPTHMSPASALVIAQQNHFSPLTDSSGTLIGWKFPAKEPSPILLVFHGNAGDALDRRYYGDIFSHLSSKWELILCEYPGFGPRPGTPGEEPLKSAAFAVLKQVKKESSQPIYVLGESLGGGVACALAGLDDPQVKGLILVTPFTSLPDVAAYHYPVFPVRPLLKDRYENLEALKTYHGPLAVILAGKDEVVPAEIGRRLFNAYTGPKQLWVVPEAAHNEAALEALSADWEAVTHFILNSPKDDLGHHP